MTEQEALNKLKYIQSVIQVDLDLYVKARITNSLNCSKRLQILINDIHDYSCFIRTTKILFPKIPIQEYSLVLKNRNNASALYYFNWYVI